MECDRRQRIVDYLIIDGYRHVCYMMCYMCYYYHYSMDMKIGVVDIKRLSQAVLLLLGGLVKLSVVGNLLGWEMSELWYGCYGLC